MAISADVNRFFDNIVDSAKYLFVWAKLAEDIANFLSIGIVKCAAIIDGCIMVKPR